MEKEKILNDLISRYEQGHRQSHLFFEKATEYQIRGGSHSFRLFDPFPFYDVDCRGSKVRDLDGNTYVDFWQGHFANILGHNPPVVLDALRECFEQGHGLITGFPGTHQKELAELILRQIKADKIRFTTSGTLATMYATMLARSFTKRHLVMKIAGGWHGAQPFALKGISIYDQGLDHMESAGLSPSMSSEILVTRFNDIEDLESKFKRHGEQMACFILELMVGAGGLIFGRPAYVKKARELTEQYGVQLIVDEIISGFRFHAGGLQTLYGIKPDLSVFGKAIGGGMPVSAVAGREEVMSIIDPETPYERIVRFEGGTFSGHPASLLAGITFISYLIEHEKEVYPRIGSLGEKVRKGLEEIFQRYGFNVKCSGGEGQITRDSSLVGVHFLREGIDEINSPEDAMNPEVCDFEMRDKVFKFAMLEEGFNVFLGYGAISQAHSEEEIQASLDAAERIARKWAEGK